MALEHLKLQLEQNKYQKIKTDKVLKKGQKTIKIIPNTFYTPRYVTNSIINLKKDVCEYCCKNNNENIKPSVCFFNSNGVYYITYLCEFCKFYLYDLYNSYCSKCECCYVDDEQGHHKIHEQGHHPIRIYAKLGIDITFGHSYFSNKTIILKQ